MDGQAIVAETEFGGYSSKDGPVLTMINKRLRALRKKYNKILQIEENKAKGKQINREQEDVLKGKLAVGVLIEEYEKLRPALKEELEKEILELRLQNEEISADTEKNLRVLVEEEEHTVSAVEDCDFEVNTGEENACIERRSLSDSSCVDGLPIEKPRKLSEDHDSRRREVLESGMVPFEREINDLLHLLYFAQLFDVPLADASRSLVWTKIHERSSCVSYDCVTEEDASSPLEDNDLSDLSLLGSLITSRPANATLSHREALQRCTKHALLWLANSNDHIKEGHRVTYSYLRERLSRILSSEYYTMTPELQTIGQQSVAAAAAGSGQHPPQLLIQAGFAGAGHPLYYANQESNSNSIKRGDHFTDALPIRNFGSVDSHSVVDAASEFVPESNIPAKTAVEPQTSYAMAKEDPQQHLEPILRDCPENGAGHESDGLQQKFEATGLNTDPQNYQDLNGGIGPGNRTTMNSQGYVVGRGDPGSGQGSYFNDQGGYFPRNQNERGNNQGIRASRKSNFDGHENGQANNRTSGVALV